MLFQTVWNALTGRPPGTGIRDADLFYFDDDTSWEAEDAVIRAGAELFADLPVPVEIRNEARVHLWYADHFGTPARRRSATAPTRSTPSRPCCCCYGVSVGADGAPRVYAPHGYDDLFALVVRPNRAPRTGARLRGQGRALAAAVAGAHRPALGMTPPAPGLRRI